MKETKTKTETRSKDRRVNHARDASTILPFSNPKLETLSALVLVEPFNKAQNSDAALEYVPPLFEDGKLVLSRTPEEIEKDSEEWKFSLVGFFAGPTPTFIATKQSVERMWKVRGNLEVFALENGFFIFKLNCEEDKRCILEGGPWKIRSSILIVKEWDLYVQLEKVEFTTLPLWVKIYNLPLFLWNSRSFSAIGSGLGKPICLDKQTMAKSRLGYAKLYVEVDALKDLPSELHLRLDGNTEVKLKLVFEWKPPRCEKCQVFGHDFNQCPDRPPVEPIHENRGRKKSRSRSRMPVPKRRWTPIRKAAEVLHNNSKEVAKVTHPPNEDIIEDIVVAKETCALQENQGQDFRSNSVMEAQSVLETGTGEGKCSSPNRFAILSDLDDDGQPNSVTLQPVTSLADQQCVSGPKAATLSHMGNGGATRIPPKEIFVALLKRQRPLVTTHLKLKEKSRGYVVWVLLRPKFRSMNADRVLKQISELWHRIDNYSSALNGRVWFCWDPEQLDVSPISITDQAIHCLVNAAGWVSPIVVSTIYGANDRLNRENLWQDLRVFSQVHNLPWVVLGDFNSILFPSEKRGGQPIHLPHLHSLESCCLDSGLSDLRWRGPLFTWTNGMIGQGRIDCKLDRCMTNFELIQNFPGAEASVGYSGTFDHRQVIIFLRGEARGKPKHFKFYNHWTSDPDFLKVVRDAWCSTTTGTPMFKLVSKMKNTKRALKSWSQLKFGNVSARVLQAKEELHNSMATLDSDPFNEHMQLKVRSHKMALQHLLNTEENVLRQRSRIQWLRLGDNNNKFFYRSLSSRNHKNRINSIKNESGNMISSEEEVAALAKGYFSSLLAADPIPPLDDLELPPLPSYRVEESEMETSKEVHSHFKYACVGYSVYLDGQNPPTDLKEKQAELPFCVGIELLLDKRPSTAEHIPDHVHNREEHYKVHDFILGIKLIHGLCFLEDGHVLPQPRAYKPPHSLGEEFLSRQSIFD
ncbi:hypothetical protein HHK36_031266 [Tetracentron sinense]|uniref:DUF4283 domain-containing protein n=1 Tax=Tetracentron sinense TaxID=13715 RepID=A0A835D2D1_TETSI|nr:hypothetical protein HHK36_031266 [Tetracentron sinense]